MNGFHSNCLLEVYVPLSLVFEREMFSPGRFFTKTHGGCKQKKEIVAAGKVQKHKARPEGSHQGCKDSTDSNWVSSLGHSQGCAAESTALVLGAEKQT